MRGVRNIAVGGVTGTAELAGSLACSMANFTGGLLGAGYDRIESGVSKVTTMTEDGMRRVASAATNAITPDPDEEDDDIETHPATIIPSQEFPSPQAGSKNLARYLP